MSSRIGKLHEQIVAAGIPVDGVTVLANGQVEVQFRAEATAAHRTQAAAIVAAFDARERRPRSVAAILSDLQGLPAADQTRARNLIIAHVLRNNPELLRQSGINIDGDEPAT